MAHTSRMKDSDKCAKKGFAAIRQDFFDSVTGSYIDITFKLMAYISLMIVATMLPFIYSEYIHGGIKEVRASLKLAIPTFIVVYFASYYLVYNMVYDPVHEISTRLLAEQDSIDAWPDEDEVEGVDILQWQYSEIEQLLEAIQLLQERANEIGEGKL
ncbi:MAG: hypothetical protein ABEJ65_08270, partial [bacterium]